MCPQHDDAPPTSELLLLLPQDKAQLDAGNRHRDHCVCAFKTPILQDTDS